MGSGLVWGHTTREGWVRFQTNLNSDDSTLYLREGHVKRWIVDAGYINNVYIQEDQRFTSVNGEIHMATITPVPAESYTKDEADAKFVPYGDFNTAGNIQVITDPPFGFRCRSICRGLKQHRYVAQIAGNHPVWGHIFAR